MFVISGIAERGKALRVVALEITYRDTFGDGLDSTCVNLLKVERSVGNFVNAILWGLHVNFNAKIIEMSGAKNVNFKIGERQRVNGFKFA